MKLIKCKSHRGDLPILASIVLIILAVVASVVLFIFTQRYVTRSCLYRTMEGFGQVLKVEGFSVVNFKKCFIFKIYVRNVGSRPANLSSAYLESSLGVVTEAYMFTSRILDPGEVGVIIAGFNLSGSKIEGTYSLKLTGSTVSAIAVSSDTLKKAPCLKVYIIDLSSQGVPGWWSDPKLIRYYFEKYAYVEVVDTWDKLDRLIRNPPPKAIVVNAHGELVPMPDTWSSWGEYFTRIGEDIRDRGWIWVSVKGYPFFYYFNESSGTIVTVGSQGVNTVLSVVGASADFWSASDEVYETYLTETGVEASRLLEISVWSKAETPRACRRITGTAPAAIFYSFTKDGKTYYGSAAYRIGNGFLIVNGFSPDYSSDQAAKVAAITVAYMYFYYRAVKPHKIFKTPPYVYVLALENTHGHWVDKDRVAEGATWFASLYTPNVVLISSYSDLENLINSPPEKCIVVNAHGEAVPIPDSYVGDSGPNWRIWPGSSSIEVYLASVNPASYTLYKEIDVSRYPQGFKIVYEHAVLSEAWFSIGVYQSPGPPDVADTTKRVFTLETRVSVDSQPNPDFLFVWGTSTEFGTKAIGDEVEYFTWYRVELEVCPSIGGKAYGVVRVYKGDQLVAEAYELSDKLYSSIGYIVLGVWGVSGRDASYLVNYVELYKRKGNTWELSWRADTSNWRSFWLENDKANDPYRPRWGGYFARIVYNIRTKGWIWVSIVGYPFYYVVNVHYAGTPSWGTGDSDHEWHIGNAGINFIIRLMGGTAGSFFLQVDCVLTTLGREAANTFVEAEIPSSLSSDVVVRAQRLYDFSSDRIYVFYDDTGGDPSISGAVAIKYGEGFLELNGFSYSIIKTSEAFALLLYKKFLDS